MNKPHTEYHYGNSLLFPLRGVHLHTMIKGAGRQLTCDRNYSWDGTKRGDRDMVIWQYTVSGCGAVDYAQRTILLEPGKAFLLMVPEKHRYYLPECSDHWEFMYINRVYIFCGNGIFGDCCFIIFIILHKKPAGASN